MLHSETHTISLEMADMMTDFSTMKTGKADISELKQYVKWEGRKQLKYWASAEANAVRGTDGTQFHPEIQESEELLVFVDSAFRYTLSCCTLLLNLFTELLHS
jgi:hypothetical protein